MSPVLWILVLEFHFAQPIALHKASLEQNTTDAWMPEVYEAVSAPRFSEAAPSEIFTSSS
jgi:hypothetical protein